MTDKKSGVPDPDTTEPAAPQRTPLGAFAERHRLVLGIIVAVFAAVVGIYAASQPADLVPRVAGAAIWAFIAGYGLTWALRGSRLLMNAFAYIAIASWVAFLVTNR